MLLHLLQEEKERLEAEHRLAAEMAVKEEEERKYITYFFLEREATFTEYLVRLVVTTVNFLSVCRFSEHLDSSK